MHAFVAATVATFELGYFDRFVLARKVIHHDDFLVISRHFVGILRHFLGMASGLVHTFKHPFLIRNVLPGIQAALEAIESNAPAFVGRISG